MSRKVRRIFSVANGYNAADFLHFGIDNIAAAELLFKANARYFDSAGYLAHLGLELILKAWHLHAFSQFEEGHLLLELWEKLGQCSSKPSIDKENSATLARMDKYFSLRYPDPSMSEEIGSEELGSILSLQAAIVAQMPREMHELISTLNGVRKGGRILMEKPIGS